MRCSHLCLMLATITLLAFFSACGGGSTPTSSAGNAADFSLTVGASSETVVAGNSTSYPVTITARNGFAGAVALSTAGLPAGAAASFSPIASGSSTLTVSTTSTTPAATSTLTVTGTSGALQHAGTAALVVSPAPDFALTVTSNASVVAGGSAAYTLTIGALNGFTGSVALSGSSLPAGVNGWFEPTSVTGSGTSVLTVTTAANLPPSSYNFAVSGVSNGVTHSANSSLAVSAPTGAYTLSTSPVQQTVTVGGATGYLITVTPNAGFSQNVVLSASGLPSGATATFTPSTVAEGFGSSTMVVTTASSAAVCCARISVTGAAGTQKSAITLPLAVIAPGRPITNVFVLAMQNQDWSTIKGSANAPYINKVLLPMASHAEQYSNPPAVHPDLPNYLWLEAGGNLGIADNNTPSVNSQSTTSHLVSMLSAAGKTWKSYDEDIDGTTCPLTSVTQYAVYTNPFVYFDDITNNNSPSSANCIAHIRPFSELSSDLQNNTVANYSFITPSTCDSMSICSIDTGDLWLSINLPIILNSPAYQSGGLILITWNQAVTTDGPIGMIVLSPNAKGGGYQNSTHYTHGSTLRSVEEIFGLAPYLADAASQADLGDLFVSFP